MSTSFPENQKHIEVEANFKFQPISFSWVAIHPKPKGIIQFIGGAFFGTFPTIFYDFFLRKLFEEGYTIVALPFRFTFDHWSVSLQLLREQYVVRKALIEDVKRLKYEPQIYLEDRNYRWVGHSLGCKYIILLELLSGLITSLSNGLQWQAIWQQIKPSLPALNQQNIREVDRQLEKLKDKVEDIYHEWREIKKAIENIVEDGINLQGLFIRDQKSLLIAPDISDTDSAIPIEIIAKLIDRLGWGAKPTKAQTQLLIANSLLFSLTAILSFEKDMIAGNLANSTGDSDVAWLVNTLGAKLRGNAELKDAFHLEPHGHQAGNFVVDFPGAIIVWTTGLAFAPLSPFSLPAKAFFNEVRKPIVKTLTARSFLENTVLNLL